MTKSSSLDRVTAIVLREMRGPIFMLIVVYTIGMVGIVLIPGQDADGNRVHMSFFHAFYFMTYTSTTTGFGELPHGFTEGQRMWAIACLLLSVVTWLYAIGSIVRLISNPHFTRALAQRRFAIAVSRIREPFVIICGFGDTGSLLARGLSDRGITGVVIDEDLDRIKALRLRQYAVPMPGLCADASVPGNLTDAGLDRPNCRAVVVLTDEDLGLKIAVMTRLLNPAAQIICRCPSRSHDEELRSLGSAVIADPFEAYARKFALALHWPQLYTLDEWIVGARGASLRKPIQCPFGTWILCGYGRMGHWLHQALSAHKVPTVVIAPNVAAEPGVDQKVEGVATKTTLREAGAAEAAGVLAATNNDTDNLSILLNARAINPDIFLVVRQNHHENELAFSAAKANLIMQPSLVSARRILLTLISPLIQVFLDGLEAQPDLLAKKVYPRLLELFKDDNPPALWVVRVSVNEMPAVLAMMRTRSVTLHDLLRDPRDRTWSLGCVPLLLVRAEAHTLMPDPDMSLQEDDQLLMCGVKNAKRLLDAAVANEYTLEYLITGTAPPRTSLARLVHSWSARTSG